MNLILIFFPGCPSYPQVKSALDEIGVSYELVNQDLLTRDSKFLSYSSPTVLFDDRGDSRIIFGARTDANSRGCSFSSLSSGDLVKLLRSEIFK